MGVEEVPTFGSKNLVDSGGIYSKISIKDFDLTVNGYISNVGEIKLASSYRKTNKIPVFVGSKIYGRAYGGTNVANVAFFTQSDVFISGVVAESSGMFDISVSVPTNTAYAIFSTKLTDIDETYFVVKQTEQINNAFGTIQGQITNFGEKIETIKDFIGIDYTDKFSVYGYLNEDGTLHALQSTAKWRTTTMIPVKDINGYMAYIKGQVGATALACFYDSSGVTISGSTILPTVDDFVNINGNVPNGAAHMRFCTYIEGSEYYLKVFSNKAEVSESPYKYHHNIHKPYVFNGKTAAFFGDSVTRGVYSDSGGVHTLLTDCYRTKLCDILGLTGSNFAVSGSFICDTQNTSDSILNQVLNNIDASSNYDYIFIAGGINDYWTGKPLGGFSDNTYATFYGALKVMCTHLNTTLAGKDTQVIFLTPLNYSSQRTDLSNVADLNEYRNAIFEIATMYGYAVVDTSVIGFPNEKDDTPYKQAVIYDGIHPTLDGHHMMAKNIASILL